MKPQSDRLNQAVRKIQSFIRRLRQMTIDLG
ncbi:hypothetical protein SK3146_02696 [Paenibacillus konkukensis]|uniref:Transposase n=1 Tax=Paenibacillus konkukensis TaxID=2020716 RepID=A0ABY4RP59_9BACL|nr:hypothetical protein SK3146_02696 [Paenibacillus konkukensis]